ncbi:MAG: PH domain-containing protein [Nocardioidaceae bacterium]|nr:PH domain-containing protein [Nocardioidaceae bacterium]
MPNAALDNAGPLVEKFAATGGRMLGYAAGGSLLVVALGAAISDPVVNRQLALGCVGVALLSWVALVRPMVAVHARGLVLRNMVRDICVPWSLIERCKVNQTLQVVTPDRQFHGLGVSRSARSIIRADKTTSKMQMRTPSFLGIGGAGGGAQDSTLSRRANQEASGGSYTDYVASRVLDMARRGKKNDEAGAVAVVAWDWLALGALALAVACLALMLV